MSRFLRMTYGHGGTKLERVMVSAAHWEPAPTPRWLRLLMVAVWIVVPALISLYALPKSSVQQKTIIDISKLTIKPPPALEKPLLARPKPTPPPIEPTPEPAPQQEPIREPEAIKPAERLTIAPPPTEIKRPTISRPAAPNLPEVRDLQPRVSRERSRVETVTEPVTKERIRRETSVSEAPSERTAITRSRGVTAMDATGAPDQVAVRRRTAPSADHSSAAGGESPQRSIQRSQRPAAPAGGEEQRVVATRERSKVAGAAGDGDGASPVGLTRGVTLMNLEICSSPQKQEEAIRAVLGVVGSRQSCRDDKGEFQFKGTQRISSFNLMIYPSKGRRPSNRCEELENAYTCLKTH